MLDSSELSLSRVLDGNQAFKSRVFHKFEQFSDKQYGNLTVYYPRRCSVEWSLPASGSEEYHLKESIFNEVLIISTFIQEGDHRLVHFRLIARDLHRFLGIFDCLKITV